jgi:hypothetical protein
MQLAENFIKQGHKDNINMITFHKNSEISQIAQELLNDYL